MSLYDDDPEAFPWHLGIFDAHSHPTDTMATLAAALPSMQAAALVIMATRSQDQHLVAQAVDLHARARCRLIPSFGWHPWFSHRLYDDEVPSPTFQLSELEHHVEALHQAKKQHYRAVLVPAPEDDDLIRCLPTPTPLSSYIAEASDLLRRHPHALVGEAGLDKSFRIPRPWDAPSESSRDNSLTPGGREGRLLSPYRVRMPHQQVILARQLRLAATEDRSVSLHGVQAHGLLYQTVSALWKGHERHVPSRRERRRNLVEATASDTEDEIKSRPPPVKAFPPRICLHSFSGSVELLAQWMHPSVPADVFVSLSAAVNLGSDDDARAKLDPVIRAVPDDRILVESDLHEAGPSMDDALERMYRVICAVKGWSLDHGVRRIGLNFRHFVFGSSSGGEGII